MHKVGLPTRVVMPNSRVQRRGTSDHPLGTGRIKRHAAPARPLLAVRQQGRDAATAELGWVGCRPGAISDCANSATCGLLARCLSFFAAGSLNCAGARSLALHPPCASHPASLLPLCQLSPKTGI